MYPPRLVSGALAMLIFAGCQHYQAKPLDALSAQHALAQRSLTEPELQGFIVAQGFESNDAWDLDRLFLAGYFFSPELDIAHSQINEADGARRTAEALPNPKVSFTPGYNQDANGATPWSFGYALNLPIEISGQRALRRSAAELQIESSHIHFAEVRWGLWSTLRRHLIELHAAESVAQLWRDQQPLLQRTADLVAAQVAAGEVSPLAATKAQIALHQATIDARASERAAVEARSRLAETIGVPLEALANIQFSYQGLDTPSSVANAANLHTQAAQHRLDLVQSLSTYAAAQIALQQEVRRQWPDFALSPGFNLDQGEGKWTLALDFSLPLLNQNQGPIATAEARRATAAAEFIAVQNRVVAEVDRAWAHYTSARKNLATIAALKAQLQRQTQLVQAQQTAGETSQLEVTRARIELVQGTRVALDALIQVEVALAAVEDATQNPFSLPLSRDHSTAFRPRVLP
jgi:cobalt-zinc-cadmium efflux system outer membrane protein